MRIAARAVRLLRARQIEPRPLKKVVLEIEPRLSTYRPAREPT